MGGRNDWDGWIVLPWDDHLPLLSGAVVALYRAAIAWWLGKRFRSSGRATASTIDLIMLVVAGNLLIAANGPLKEEGPIVRYMLPLSGVLPIVAAWFCRQLRRRGRWLCAIALFVLLVHNGYFSVLLLTSGTRYPIQSLDRWLEHAGLTRVYAGYWIAYPLAFASDERVVVSPRYGPWTQERYPEYTQIVNASPNPAFVFDRNFGASWNFGQRLSKLGITYRLDVVAGQFLVYSCFSRDPRTEHVLE